LVDVGQENGVELPSLTIRTDLEARIEELERRLVPALQPLARVAFDYRWSWEQRGPDVFAEISPRRWRLARQNPVWFLAALPRRTQLAVEANAALVGRIERLAASVAAAESPGEPYADLGGPVAFFCAEFGVHASLPVYSGGLGVLAGDLLKEASDRSLPLVGVGLLYRRGFFSQRLDLSGWQQEFWAEHDPDLLPLSLVQSTDGAPLHLTVTLFGHELEYRIWCARIGRVPLLLLDADVPRNSARQRWTTARLYDGNFEVRLAQYGLLGIGGAQTLEALGIEPAVVHLNEGHPALAALEFAARRVGGGETFDEALEDIGTRVAFTTHTPLPAGNETYPRDLFLRAFGDLPARLGVDDDRFLGLAAAEDDRVGLSQLAVRVAGRRNAVSRAHATTSREIWQPLFPDSEAPIEYVTNGAHVATHICEPVTALLAEHLGDRWLRGNPADPAAWEGIRDIPNAELWAARCAARARLVDYARAKVEEGRLLRGESLEFAEAPAVGLAPDALTLGFARRLATYKRLSLLFADPERGARLLAGPSPIQLLIAGKAHPRDEEAKTTLQRLHRLRHDVPAASGRAVFLEDYDLAVAHELVGGCDVWVNLPRPPLEASGTSGMKATFNGVLQLSVLDGWWAEAYNGSNGWAIDSEGNDEADAKRLYDLLEREVIPLFYERDADGVPNSWCDLVKEAVGTCAWRFSATRMLDDYVERVYTPLADSR
jgi:starch phosphorylase